MNEERRWPTVEMFRVMWHGTLAELNNMHGQLPPAQTDDQFLFMQELHKEIKLRELEL